MSELEEDIKHCEKVLADWHGCDECKADHALLIGMDAMNVRQTMKDFCRI